MLSLIRKRMKGEKGFTLIELLVVIIIIAILAAIAIPTFLGQRQKAQDAAAKSLIRNSMTAIEASYVDNMTFAPATMTAAVLHAIEPSITFVALAPSATVAAIPATATTSTNTVNFDGAATTYNVGTVSASSNKFGVVVDKAAAGNTFVKIVGGTFGTGW